MLEPAQGKIWLEEVAKLLSSPTNVFFGFDISTSQFPHKSDLQFGQFSFIQHDIREPFPVEYHKKFDLVNVRLLVQALAAADVKLAVTNVAELLRPGGCIQWQDLDWQDIRSCPINSDLDRINDMFMRHMEVYGLSDRISVLVESSLREIGLVDVNAEKAWHDASPARAAGSTTAVFAALTSMLLKALETSLRLEDASTNARLIEEKSEQMKRTLQECSKNGYNWTLSATLVVGKAA
ncbi:hypothetical protein N7540_007812 [Penicillium herquei]|nr:hypothetical protein N7540_007812 [Penicillium herquei]